MPEKIEISYKTFLFIILLTLGLWLLYLIRNIVFIVFIAFIIVAALNPTVEKLENKKVSRTAGILLLFLLIFALMGLIVYGIVPPLVNQTVVLAEEIPNLLSQIKFVDSEQIISFFLSQSAALPKNIIKFSMDIFNNFIAVIGLVVIIYYMLKERVFLEKYLLNVFGNRRGSRLYSIVSDVEIKLGGWVKGELLLMLFVGLLSYLGFKILGLEFALPLAVIAFFLELLPTLGPVIAGIPAVALALTVSPLLALLTAGWCFLVQQIENSLLVPRIMKASVGINPIISIVSLSIGYTLAGAGGAIISLPVFLSLEVIFKDIFASRPKLKRT